jgi:hypothetical protein
MSKSVTPKHAATFLGGKAGGAESVTEFKNTVLDDLHTPSFFLHTVGLLSQSKHQGWVNVPFSKRRAVTLKEISGLLDKRRGKAPFHAPPAVAWAPLGGGGAPEGSRAGEERVAASRAQMHAAAAAADAGDVGRNDEQLALRAATDRSCADAPAQEEARRTAATQRALSTPTRGTAEPNADPAFDAVGSTAKKRKRDGMYGILEGDAEPATIEEVFNVIEGHELLPTEFAEIQKRFKFSKNEMMKLYKLHAAV